MLEKHGTQLHALLVRLTLRYEVADDLMQELFLRLAQTKKLESVDDQAAYASRVAINLAMDWRRRSQRDHSIQELPNDLTGRQADPFLAAEQTETTQQVLDVLSELHGLGPEVLIRHYVQQEPYETIAQEVGKSPHHLRALVNKTLKKVRSRLIHFKKGFAL